MDREELYKTYQIRMFNKINLIVWYIKMKNSTKQNTREGFSNTLQPL
jgi:hypothetical protein